MASSSTWFFFINQILNFGRTTRVVNGVFTDDDQLNYDDGDIEFIYSFDFYIYSMVLGIRGRLVEPDRGLGKAIKIRHALSILIIKNFVQTAFTNRITSLKGVAIMKDKLMEENRQLKRELETVNNACKRSTNHP